MKKIASFNKGIFSGLVAVLLSSVLVISCEKQTIEIEKTTNETYIQKELTNFINNLEKRGGAVSGQLIIHNVSRKSSEEIFFIKDNEFAEILGPIINKLSIGSVVTATSEDGGPHGSADCKYCTKFGGISCGKSIANKIPENAEDIHITISKKDKNGCRTIHAEW